MPEVTPIGETQYKKEHNIWWWFTELKERHNDALLLFKVGTHYEAYYEDADVLKKICGLESYPPKIGPTHITGYIAVLENEGYTVKLLTEEEA